MVSLLDMEAIDVTIAIRINIRINALIKNPKIDASVNLRNCFMVLWK